MIGYKKYIDLIQFRLVILDEQNNVVDVLFTSKEYKPSSILDKTGTNGEPLIKNVKILMKL